MLTCLCNYKPTVQVRNLSLQIFGLTISTYKYSILSMAMIPHNMDAESDVLQGLPRMTRTLKVEKTNLIETLPWFYPGINRNIAECVLKQHDIDGSYLMIKERVNGVYEYYDLCVWNAGTPSHFQVKYRKDLDEIEFGLKKYSWSAFNDRFQRHYRIVRSDKDVILLKHPLPRAVREPSGIWDNIITQDVLLISVPNLDFKRVLSDPNLLSASSSGCFPLGVKGGYLIKQGHVRKNWLKRWFVLDKQNFSYFETKPHPVHSPYPKLKGVINLAETLRFVSEDHSVKQAFSFSIILSNKAYTICAETENDYKSWVETLKTAIDRYRESFVATLPARYK